jgi:Holliday junction resolvasome RuvABC endonuclease subunit
MIGLDPSITSTGFAVLNTDETYVASGTLKLPKYRDGRLWQIYSNFLLVLDELFPGEPVAYEHITFNLGPTLNVRFLVQYGTLKGLIELHCERTKTIYLPIGVPEWKKGGTGRGNISKPDFTRMAQQKWPEARLKASDHDRAAALYIALAGLKELP